MNIDTRFEKISKYKDDEGIIIPYRKTADSAGYDFYCAEDTVIFPAVDIGADFLAKLSNKISANSENKEQALTEWLNKNKYLTLDEMAALNKEFNTKVNLVPTGIKCYLPHGYYLQLSVRSSLPLKHWLIMANSIGVIDADYYNNPDNEGHIYFQLINLGQYPIIIKKGDCFGQGIILPYNMTNEDNTTAARVGGFGSTGSK